MHLIKVKYYLKYLDVKSIIIFLFFINQSQAQTLLENKDLLKITTDFNNVGNKIEFIKSDSTLLKPDKYIFNYNFKDKFYPINFFINSNYKPDGIIECQTLFFKSYVNNGLIYKFEQFSKDNNTLSSERFLNNDTIVIKNYNKYGQFRSEFRIFNDETFYEYNCSVYTKNDSINTCNMTDHTKGVEILYDEKGKIISKHIYKNLPNGIINQFEEYNSNGLVKELKIEYENGKTKIIYENGNYIITTPLKNKLLIEEFTKNDKLKRKSEKYK